ncbi:MAG: XdhC family protein [Oscillospiraceae bacterium]|nr:XdhC family protein [Oscillospiraceae bacterium]
MRKILDRIITAGVPLMLVSVTASSGSVPRGAGAMMAVTADGTSVGTIGGGRVEFEAQKKALEMLAEGKGGSHAYILAKNDVEDLGMICGGDVTVYFQLIAPDAIEPFKCLREALELGEDAWLVRAREGGEFTSVGVWRGGKLRFAPELDAEKVRPLLASGAVLTDEFYVEPISLAGVTYVFGGGHVARELVPVLEHVGFRCIVFEDRPDFATRELFPTAFGLVLGDFSAIGERIRIGPRDNVVIMTRGHGFDYEVIAHALATPAAYIGCIGSRRKIAATKARLFAEKGYTEEDFARVHTPIGLDIGAETPAEIAISVAAEMIRFRAERVGESR